MTQHEQSPQQGGFSRRTFFGGLAAGSLIGCAGGALLGVAGQRAYEKYGDELCAANPLCTPAPNPRLNLSWRPLTNLGQEIVINYYTIATPATWPGYWPGKVGVNAVSAEEYQALRETIEAKIGANAVQAVAVIDPGRKKGFLGVHPEGEPFLAEGSQHDRIAVGVKLPERTNQPEVLIGHLASDNIMYAVTTHQVGDALSYEAFEIENRTLRWVAAPTGTTI